ncbi:MAG: polysaccharide pyruvyl transferase family protein [Oscillospiraceae bacterium]|nr:polysaccharide pyruvyl transferase family protein [Oscillospiraceae bacterium]
MIKIKKIAIRGRMLPWDNHSVKAVLNRNLIGSNTGNLLFFNSVVRALMTDADTEFALANPLEGSGRQAAERADCLVLPFANAFRRDFNLRAWTDYISSDALPPGIPCVVVGIGAQFPPGSAKSGSAALDKDALDFCRAVLKRSASVGVRGEITYDYLRGLGLRDEEVDIIGCPSMFTRGADLSINLDGINQVNIKMSGEGRSSGGQPLRAGDGPVKIAVNGSGFAGPTGAAYRNPPWFLEFLRGALDEYPGSVFIPQELDEGLAVWQGRRPEGDKFEPSYPHMPDDPVFRQNRVRFFVNAPSWFDYLKGFDFAVGNRIHGTVAALLSGIPAMLIPTDSRTLELARYHRIPHIESTETRLDIPDLYRRAIEAIPATESRNRVNFEIFRAFLDKNGLDHIYNPAKSSFAKTYDGRKSIPYDEKMARVSYAAPVGPFCAATPIEQAVRLESAAERVVYRAYRRVMGIRDNV